MREEIARDSIHPTASPSDIKNDKRIRSILFLFLYQFFLVVGISYLVSGLVVSLQISSVRFKLICQSNSSARKVFHLRREFFKERCKLDLHVLREIILRPFVRLHFWFLPVTCLPVARSGRKLVCTLLVSPQTDPTPSLKPWDD